MEVILALALTPDIRSSTSGGLCRLLVGARRRYAARVTGAVVSRWGDRSPTGLLAGARRSARSIHRVVALCVVLLTAVTVWLALSSNHLRWPVPSAFYWGYMVAAPPAIGLYWLVRRPASRFGPLLLTFGAVAFVVGWTASDWPVSFLAAGLAEPVFYGLTLYLLLAFPAGRIESPVAAWLFRAQMVLFLAVYPVLVAIAPVLTGGGALAICAPDCPENLLQVASNAQLGQRVGDAGAALTVGIAAGVIAVYVLRLRAATRPQRRALMAVAVTSLLWLALFDAFHLADLLALDAGIVDTLEWIAAFGRILVPLGFLIALVQAEVFASRVLRTLLERLVARPTPEQWRDAVAGALDDESLELAFYDPGTGRYRRSDGRELTRPSEGSGRTWVSVDQSHRAVAAMVVDATLTEDPELVRAAARATLLAVENGALEGELRASRARIVEAGHAERRRIERDLHDGAQQRLVALRIHLELVGEQLGSPAALDRLGLEIEKTIDELRELAQGVYPALLAQAGLAGALEVVARRSGIPMRITEHGITRRSRSVETTVYFCCVECLQNVAKHAGPGASVELSLAEADGWLNFSVADDGPGLKPGTATGGSGLTNIADRLAAIGGTVRIVSRPGGGTLVTGRAPLE